MNAVAWWVMSASATTLGLTDTISLDRAPWGAVVDARAFVVVDGQRVVAVDRDGAVLQERSTDAVALVLYDVDHDDLDDVVLCGPSGVAWLRWEFHLEPITQLDPSPCTKIVARAGGLVSAGSSVLVHEDLGDFVVTTHLEELVVARLAATEDTIAWADQGASSWVELGPSGRVDHGVAGTMEDLHPSAASSFWVAQSNPDALADPVSSLTVSSTPLSLDAADIDGDLLSDVVVSYANGVGVFGGDGSAEATHASLGPVLASAELDSDPCTELLVADPSGLVVLEATDCDPDADADGVPWSMDCDDGDPARYPGADELCDGLDNDCDGRVDDPGALTIEAPPGNTFEGDEIILVATATGCLPVAAGAWSFVPERLADCTVTGQVATCTARDDGALRATFTVGADTTDSTVHIDNVDPTLDLPNRIADGSMQIDVGESWSESVSFEDVGDDLVTVSLSGDWPSPDVRLSPSGEIVVNPRSEGRWVFDIVATDDDGGSTSSLVELVVSDPYAFSENDDEETFTPEADHVGCGCASHPGPAGSVVLLPLALLIRRRR